MIKVTDEFRQDINMALNNFDYTKKELAHDLDVSELIIYAMLNGRINKIDADLYAQLEHWMAHDKTKSMAERLLLNVEYKKMKSMSQQTSQMVLLQLNGTQRDLFSDADNAAHFLEHDFTNVDTQLAHWVLEGATRAERLGYIQDYRTELVADFGKTLMEVPEDEPRLLALQLANRMLG